MKQPDRPQRWPCKLILALFSATVAIAAASGLLTIPLSGYDLVVVAAVSTLILATGKGLELLLSRSRRDVAPAPPLARTPPPRGAGTAPLALSMRTSTRKSASRIPFGVFRAARAGSSRHGARALRISSIAPTTIRVDDGRRRGGGPSLTRRPDAATHRARDPRVPGRDPTLDDLHLALLARWAGSASERGHRVVGSAESPLPTPINKR
jgi:hypothetical protein